MAARTKKTPAKAGNRKTAGDSRHRKAGRKAARRVSAPRRPKSAPGKGARRRNGAAENAAELYRQFHGTEATKVVTVEEEYNIPTELADLGKLIQLTVWTDEDNVQDIRPAGNVRVAATGEGGSIYFVGGDQRLDLKALDREEGLPKDHVVIGPVEEIVYKTSKDFHDFEPIEYQHQFGEETGTQPVLCYDTRARRMYLVGGAYRVRRPGIEN